MFPSFSGLSRSPSISKRVYDTIAILLISLAAIAIAWRMLRDGINGLGDLSWHMTWIQHFALELTETIYPRWLGGTNYGYGSPTFVFYPPLVYYLGALLRRSGFDIQQTIAVLCTIALFTSGLGFYIYTARKWGKLAAVVGALFYVSAPQLTNLAYFGGIPALFAQPLMPLGLYFTDKALEQPRWKVVLALFWAAVALTHVPTLLLCTIAWVGYLFVLMIQQSWKRILPLFASAGIGFGLAGFFLLPAVLEQSFANIKALKAVNGGFQANMIGRGQLQLLPLSQLQKMAYIYVHQGIAILIFSAIALTLWNRKTVLRPALGVLGFAIALAFMMSILSAPVWEASPTLQMVQFPVRLLGMFALAGGISCTIAVYALQRSRLKILFALIIVAVLVANFRYSFQLARRLPTLNHAGRGTIMNLETIKAIVHDPYSDNLIDLPEYRPPLDDGKIPEPLRGQAPVMEAPKTAKIDIKRWTGQSRVLNIDTPEPAILKLRTYYHPAWQGKANEAKLDLSKAKDGTIEIRVPSGKSEVQLWYGWTTIFTIGVAVSSLSAIALILLWRWV